MKGIMNIYYEDYYNNIGNVENLKEYVPYVVFCTDYEDSVSLIDFLASEGYDVQKHQAVGYSVVLVNTELKRVSGISAPCNHDGIQVTKEEFLNKFYPELNAGI